MRVRMTITLDEKTIDELDSFPRNRVKNKSALIEGLLKEWIRKEKKLIEKEEEEDDE